MFAKKSVFLCGAAVAACLMGAPAQAQDTPPEGERPRGRRQDGEGRRGEGRRGQGRRGGFRGPNLEELGLSEEQKAKVDKLMADFGEKLREARESRDREAMRGLRNFIPEGLAKILTPEQMKKYEEAQAARRRGGFGRGRGGEGGNRGGFGRGGEGGRGRGNPAERDKRLVEDVKKALVLSESEEGTVVPAIEKVLAERRTAQQATEKSRREFLEALKTGLTGEELQSRLTKFRSERDAAEQKVKAASDALAGMVDTEQKAKLVAFGVLR